MKKLTQLWQAVENTPGLIALPAMWQEICGPDRAWLEPYLIPTPQRAPIHPCPYPSGASCPREIIHCGGEKYAALCRDPHKRCDDLLLGPRDILLHRLDLQAFLRPILAALGIRAQPLVLSRRGVWSIGLSRRRSSLNQPCYLLIFPEGSRFQAAVRDLLIEVSGPFVIVAPTNRYRSGAVQELLQARGIAYIALEEQAQVDDQGELTTVEPIESADKGSPTPIQDRDRMI